MTEAVRRRGLWQTWFTGSDLKAPDGDRTAAETSAVAADDVRIGWSQPEVFNDPEGTLYPRIIRHGTDVHMLYGRIAGGNIAKLHHSVYTPGTGWRADGGKVLEMYSEEAPALLSSDGKLYALARAASHVRLAVLDPAGSWSEVELTVADASRSGGFQSSRMPAMTYHKDQFHVLFTREGISGAGVKHSILDGGVLGEPVHVTDKEPDSRLSLVTYDGALHLMFTRQGILHHFVNNGAGWAEQATISAPTAGSPGSAVYDGKIYTAYNIAVDTPLDLEREISALIEAWRAASDATLYDDGSGRALLTEREARYSRGAQPVPIAAADVTRLPEIERSRLYAMGINKFGEGASDFLTALQQYMQGVPYNKAGTLRFSQVGYQVFDGVSWSGSTHIPVNADTPPSLAVYHEKGDPTRGRLMLNYAGTESWTPPPPPPPQPVGSKVVAAKKASRTDYGIGSWSKTNHTLEAEVRRNDAGCHHIVAKFAADAYWLDTFGVARRDSGRISARIKLTTTDNRLIDDFEINEAFSHSVRRQVAWEVRAGTTYNVILTRGEKTLGAWFPNSPNSSDRTQEERQATVNRYSTVELALQTITIDVPST
ncbi:hypothetical protein [Streptomyces sp. NPDC029003]|uniref:hypothetical protein n=1 Tax=Streptomyces sp. NPDC029003 TaxID=3155125 RepID=UPI0033D6433D